MSTSGGLPIMESPWTLRRRMAAQVARLELARSLAPAHAIVLLFVAFAPVALLLAHARVARACDLQVETGVLATIVQLYYLRVGIFFGCLGIFMRLLGGERTEHTLHYLFLAPLRRDVLLLGKFVAGALLTMVVFASAVAAAWAATYFHFPEGREFALQGPGLAHLRHYLAVTVLACLGYGAAFLAFSLVFKNPVVPAFVVFLWEGIVGALPVALKHLSLTFYLKALFPFELPAEGFLAFFTVVAEPLAPSTAVAGALALTLVPLAFAAWRLRALEVSYTD